MIFLVFKEKIHPKISFRALAPRPCVFKPPSFWGVAGEASAFFAGEVGATPRVALFLIKNPLAAVPGGDSPSTATAAVSAPPSTRIWDDFSR